VHRCLDRLRLSWPDVLLAGLLAMATLVVHDVGYMLSTPFWTDEAWVAISTKLPFSQLHDVSASAPLGCSFLLRLVVGGADERLLSAALAGCVALLVPPRWSGTGSVMLVALVRRRVASARRIGGGRRGGRDPCCC
jgi:hypothetical protein